MTAPPDTPGPSRQLAFDLPHESASGLEDFILGEANARALDFVLAWPQWPAPAAVLAGPAGAGKSHLARIWTARAGAVVCAAGDEALARLVHAPAQRVVVEDIDRGPFDETALFHVFNHTVETGGSLLVTARTVPARWRIALADLDSRLRAASLVEIDQPDEALIEAVLVKLLADRQIDIEPDVASYALNRMERSLAAARDLAHRIDRRSLEEGRGVTTRLVARVLGDGSDEGGP